MTHLIAPANGAVVPTHTNIQRDFRKKQHHTVYEGTIDWVHPERSGNEECTHPLPTVFRWSTDEPVSHLRIGESPDLADALCTEVAGDTLPLDNFKIGTTYFWQVNDSEIFRFTTEDIAPRFIRCEGPSNVRDIGGWRTRDGRRMKQGIVYRSGAPETAPGDFGVSVLVEKLGVRCEIELRREMLGKRETSFFGDAIRYFQLPCDGYLPFLEQKSECKAVMEAIADDENYPLVFHCTGGADRTGTTAFMLEALCGVEEDDLFLDYELTTLSVWGERSRNAAYFQEMLTGLRAYGEENTPWQILTERFFLDCGVSPETIAKLRENLLED